MKFTHWQRNTCQHIKCFLGKLCISNKGFIMSKDWVRMWCMAFEDLGLVKVNVGYMRGQIRYYMSELLKLRWVHVSTHNLVSMPKNWRPSLSHWIDYLWRPSASHGQWRWLSTKFDQGLLIFPRLLFHTLTLQTAAQPVRGRFKLLTFFTFWM